MSLGILTYPTQLPAPSFGHIEFRMADFPIIAIVAANYSRVRTREMGYGAHPDPLYKSLGTNAYKCDAEMYKPQLDQLVVQLAQKAIALGVGFGDVPFDTVTIYNVPGFGVVTDTITGCTLDEQEASNAQGNGLLKRKINVNPMKILWNGLDDMGPNSLAAQAVFQAISSVVGSLV